MKILRRDFKHGKVTVLPQVLDDLWVLYNVISRGDLVYAKTRREVRFGERYDRPEKGKRISVLLGLKVEKVLWDRVLNRLRVHGIVSEAPDEIGALGSHHTITVELNKPLTIMKDRWPRYQIERLEKAEKAGVAPLIILAIDDEGYCVTIMRHFTIEVKVEEKVGLPGKRRAEGRAKALRKLFNSALQALRESWMESKSPIVIVGVGFVKTDFLKYLREEAPEIAEKVIDVKGVNSVGVAGVHEALRSGILKKALRDLRIAEETEAVEEVLSRVGRGRGDVAYGLLDVEKAVLLGAVENLLITDTQLRGVPDEKRRRMEELMRNVERKGGRVVIVSTEHEAGVKLQSLGGVAALLRFPVKS